MRGLVSTNSSMCAHTLAQGGSGSEERRTGREKERGRGEAAAHLLPVLAVSEGLALRRDDAAVAHSSRSSGDLFHCYDDSGGGGGVGAFENGEGLRGKVAGCRIG